MCNKSSLWSERQSLSKPEDMKIVDNNVKVESGRLRMAGQSDLLKKLRANLNK